MNTSIIGIVAISIIFIGGFFLYVHKRNKLIKACNEYIDTKIVFFKSVFSREAAREIKNLTFSNVEDFENHVFESSMIPICEKIILEEMNDDIINKNLPLEARDIMTEEYIKSRVKILMQENGISSEIRAIYCENIVKSTSEYFVNKDKELQSQFSSDDYFEDEEEVDNLKPGDLESDDTEYDKKIVGDNDIEDVVEKEIIPPKDDLDITEDPLVTEEVNEDGLTKEEVAAGIRFNKAGRKVDAKGRFVKLK